MTTKTAVKERPILFSAPMVRAILEGRKTQTRRVVKAVLSPSLNKISWQGDGWYQDEGNNVFFGRMNRPYGQPGDRLWVRETWTYLGGKEAIKASAAVFGGFVDACCIGYKATDEFSPEAAKLFEGWFPSIHMPRWASRIDLEVVKVRVERLQDISEEDCIAEGLTYTAKNQPFSWSWGGEKTFPTAKLAYIDLWKSINGAGDANPWVWVVEFKRVRP